MAGLLNINKQAGSSSRDTVNRVHRLVRPVKTGHCGTLDPMADGVLVVCLGRATRLAHYVQRMRKTYVGSFRLGCESDSEDTETEVRQLVDAPVISRTQLESVLPQFLGEIKQMPPAYSALKVDGKRAYRLARKGKQVKLESRDIVVYRLELVQFEYPDVVFEIECGAGTYVRSLGRDIGKALKSNAVMTALTRTAIGEFRIEDSLDEGSIDAESVSTELLNPVLALPGLTQVTLDEEAKRNLGFGRPVRFSFDETVSEVAAVDDAGGLLALLTRRENGEYAPKVNLCAIRNSPSKPN